MKDPLYSEFKIKQISSKITHMIKNEEEFKNLRTKFIDKQKERKEIGKN